MSALDVWLSGLEETDSDSRSPERLVTEMAVAGWQVTRLPATSEEPLRLASSLVPLGIWEIDVQGRQLARSAGLDQLYGLTETPRSVGDFLTRHHPEDARRMWEMFVAAGPQGNELTFEYRIVRPDGQLRHLSSRSEIVRDAAGVPRGIRGVTVDVSERVEQETKLREGAESQRALRQQLQTLHESLQQRIAERTLMAEQRAAQLRRLAAELTQAEQRERRRLAQMLHDHLQQLLYAARLRLGWVRRHILDGPLHDALQEVDTLLDQSIGESRSLTMELSPPVLYDGGLAASLDWLARTMYEKHGLVVKVHLDPSAEPVEEDTRVVLFQIVRELLFNIVKHAQTEHACVEMSQLDTHQLQIVVEDHGVGFDPARLEAVGVEARGFGLFSIRERLDVIGGALHLETAPGQGTRIRVLAPREPHPEESKTAPVKSARAARVAQRQETAKAASSAPARTIRVLVADDHAILREGLITLLAEEPQIEVVAEACDGQEAVELALAMHPDVVLMDVTMPLLSGIEATRRIAAELPDVRVIGLSMHQEQDMATAMHEAGAVAYLRKGDSSDNVIAAIRGTL